MSLPDTMDLAQICFTIGPSVFLLIFHLARAVFSVRKTNDGATFVVGADNLIPIYLIGWSWINAAATKAEFYMGCADIKIVGASGGGGNGNGEVLPAEIANVPLRIANMPGQPYYHANGDQFGNTRSNGPSAEEVDANMKGLTGGPDNTFQPNYAKRKRSGGRRVDKTRLVAT